MTSEAFYDFNNKDWWTKNEAGEQILKVENIPISHIGTDPAQAADMLSPNGRRARKSRVKSSSFAFALGEVVEKTVNYVFDQKKPPASPADRKRIDGYMPNELRGELAYKVRPLNGVWATPPYLHNGSVPTIDDLLGDPEKRPPKFYLGSREYDPVKLGYKTDPIDQRFRIRHLDSRQLEPGPRIQEGLQQGQGNQGRDRTGAVGGRSKGVDRVPQDTLRSSHARCHGRSTTFFDIARVADGSGDAPYPLATSRRCGLIVASSSTLSWCTRGSPERASAHRIFVDGARQRVPFFRRPRHFRAGQPQHHPAELHQHFIECPIHTGNLIHGTAPFERSNSQVRPPVPGARPLTDNRK